MEKRILELKETYAKIVEIKEDNVGLFLLLEEKVKKVKDSYNELIKINKGQLFIFGLDSLHFQGKILDIEYDDMKRIYYAITNRMYCEYFKLYKIIVGYISMNIDEEKLRELIRVNDNYPTYKDLEPFKQYEFSIIDGIHDFIVVLLSSINAIIVKKEHDLKNYQIKNDTGLNINNFVHSFNFKIVLMKDNLLLFITYLEYFHKTQIKFMKRFSNKLQLMYSQLNNDIKFEDTSKNSKIKRKNMIETLENDSTEKDLISNINETDSSLNSPTISPSNSPISSFISLDNFNKKENEIISNNDIAVPEEFPQQINNIFLSITDNIQDKDKDKEQENLLLDFTMNEEVISNKPQEFVGIIISELLEELVSKIENTNTNVPIIEEDNISAVTLDSEIKNESGTDTNETEEKKPESDEAPPKKKRTYKPRKKKTEQ
jgi:hypothetical protein